MALRLRLPELLDHAELTAWGLHRASGGRISASTAYRLVRSQGRLKAFEANTVEALADVLGVPVGDLFEREGAKPKKRAR